jgi:hypothetical protein
MCKKIPRGIAYRLEHKMVAKIIGGTKNSESKSQNLCGSLWTPDDACRAGRGSYALRLIGP